MKRLLLPLLIFSLYIPAFSQQAWIDSVFNSLSEDQRIAQLMVVRLSEKTSEGIKFYDQQVEDYIKKYNIGAICLFQGGPVKQAQLINHLQSIAQTPIMVCIDGETGLGMRITDSVAKFPDQLTLGAMQDAQNVYKVGKAIADQCRRMGIHVNYAPVVDVNNNPDNPVINFRSFGENKYKVALFGTMMMRGMQDAGVMACAKHFPGHGDVSVDSHLDLPIITKTRFQLDSLELYPFKELFKAGVGSVMIAHLYIPAIDSTANRATSISYNNVTGLLRNELGYKGLTFTDALEMQGVKKFFPDGQASVESLIAGNDMLCLPGDIQLSIDKIKEAIDSNRLTWEDINIKVKKVLAAKYKYVLPNITPINTVNLAQDLNVAIPALRKMIAANAITLVRNENAAIFPLRAFREIPSDFPVIASYVPPRKKIAYIGIGLFEDNTFARRMREDYKADIYYFNYRMTSSGNDSIINKLKEYDVVIAGVHNYTKYPANNFGFSWASTQLMKRLQQETPAITLFFGNPYAIKSNCDAKNIMACYEDDSLFQHAAADILEGKLPARGKLPVTICEGLPFGTGIISTPYLSAADPDTLKAWHGYNHAMLEIDSIVQDAIAKKATPGCVVLVAKDGKIVYNKAFGNYSWDDTATVTPTPFVRTGYGDSQPHAPRAVQKATTESIYDLASVTKVFATTLTIMKLYDEGKIDLKKTLGDYLPWVRKTNKAGLVIEDVLLHQAGLAAFIPFYKETLLPGTGVANYTIYMNKPTPNYSVRVADSMYMRNDWVDTIYKRILESPLGPKGKYVYSDLDFIFLGKIVETVTSVTLDIYAKKEFYDKLNLFTTGYKPREHFALDQIVPTEREIGFRSQLLRGDVHDPGAAMLGGVAGHAGLFSDAYDLAVLSQLLLNGGSIGGQQFIKKSTIDLFTSYHSEASRRGYGFDKPEKDNAERKEPYPCASASPLTYGHTGFTGTCVWIDPASNLVYIFLSNRVNSFGPNKLAQMDVRGKVQEVIYKAIEK